MRRSALLLAVLAALLATVPAQAHHRPGHRPTTTTSSPTTTTGVTTTSMASTTVTIAPPGSQASLWRWGMAGSTLSNIRAANDPVATDAFNTNRSVITGPWDGDQSQVPAGWTARVTANFKSFADFQSKISGATMDPAVTEVVYDPEMWAETPTVEQTHPRYYMQQFVDLGHANGYRAGWTSTR